MKRKTIISVLLVAVMYCMPLISHAQPDPGGDPDANVPIDGGLSILLAAGVSYVAKKGYDKRKKGIATKPNELKN